MPKGIYEHKKGIIPWNKGIKMSELFRNAIKVRMKGQHRSPKTQFKKGQIPWNKDKKMPQTSKENHYLWVNDRTKLKTSRRKDYDTRYKYWMIEVKNRDNWKCKINNSDCKGRLEAHHILSWRDYKELRYDINNGITLCQFHHPLKRKDEERLSPYFKKLVAEMK